MSSEQQGVMAGPFGLLNNPPAPSPSAPCKTCASPMIDRSQDGAPGDSTSVTLEGDNGGSYFPWREELESLVRGGVPIALRGEVQLQPELHLAFLSSMRYTFTITFGLFSCRCGKHLWVLVLGKSLGITTNC